MSDNPEKNNVQVSLENMNEKYLQLGYLLNAARVAAHNWIDPMIIEAIVSCSGTLFDYTRELRLEAIDENDGGIEDYCGSFKESDSSASQAYKDSQIVRYEAARQEATGEIRRKFTERKEFPSDESNENASFLSFLEHRLRR